MSEPLRNVGWGPIPLPGERKRQEAIGTAIHAAAEKALEPQYVLVVDDDWFSMGFAVGPLTLEEAKYNQQMLMEDSGIESTVLELRSRGQI